MFKLLPLLNLPTLQGLLGNPVRVFSFGTNDGSPVVTPYVTWQLISTNPLNNVDAGTTDDAVIIQVDVYGKSKNEVTEIAITIRKELEKIGYCVGQRELPSDGAGLFRVSTDFEIIIKNGL